jgi:hypothetical protein
MTQLPCRFHMSANSPRSISGIEVNFAERLQLWSLPWHARLRSLAKGFVADPGAKHLPPSAPDNWLARAHAGAAPGEQRWFAAMAAARAMQAQ